MNASKESQTGRSWTHRMRWLLIVLGLLGLALVAIYLWRPVWLLDAEFARQRWLAGLEPQEISFDHQHWRYVEGGHGETVLLVHGFAGSKENWYLPARFLTNDFHVIAPDQAGFGDSVDAPDDDYRITQQVRRLHAFAKAKGLTRFHLVGHSMGGQIAGMYAVRYPEQVQSLTLMNSAGVEFPRNAFQQELEAGGNPFAATDLESFDRFMAMAFETPPFAPPRVRAAYAERIGQRAKLWHRVLDRLKSENTRYLLQRHLPKISAPTLVLWCDRDQLLGIGSLDAFRAGLPNARIEVLTGCGHMTMMERPRETAELLRGFFRG